MICVKLLLSVSAVDKSNVILVWQEAQPVLQDCPGAGGGEWALQKGPDLNNTGTMNICWAPRLPGFDS